MQKIGYEGNGSIRKRKGVVEPIDPLGLAAKYKIGLGYDISSKETTSKQSHDTILALQESSNTIETCLTAIQNFINNNSKIDYGEYEWDTIQNYEFWRDKQVDVIHKYACPLIKGEGSGTQPHKSKIQHDYTSSDTESDLLEQDYHEDSAMIDLSHKLDPTNTSITTLTIADLTQLNDPLLLIHPNLIDWDLSELDIPMFPIDESIVNDFSTGNFQQKVFNQESVKSRSYKIKNQKERSNGEKQNLAVLDQPKDKTKSVLDGEIFFKAPDDGMLDTLPEHYHE